MLLTGIVLTVVGLLIVSWAGKAQNQPRYTQPLIFHNPVVELFIYILCIGLLISGQFFLWKVSPIITGVCVSLFIIVLIVGANKSSDVKKARNFFVIYKKSKACHPNFSEFEILKDAAHIYFAQIGRREYEIDVFLEHTFKDNTEDLDVKKVADSILVYDGNENLTDRAGDFKSMMKYMDKKEKAIEKAYNSVFG